jgi:hypothetical protein
MRFTPNDRSLGQFIRKEKPFRCVFWDGITSWHNIKVPKDTSERPASGVLEQNGIELASGRSNSHGLSVVIGVRTCEGPSHQAVTEYSDAECQPEAKEC